MEDQKAVRKVWSLEVPLEYTWMITGLIVPKFCLELKTKQPSSPKCSHKWGEYACEKCGAIFTDPAWPTYTYSEREGYMWDSKKGKLYPVVEQHEH